jgi:hypothetical protein
MKRDGRDQLQSTIPDLAEAQELCRNSLYPDRYYKRRPPAIPKNGFDEFRNEITCRFGYRIVLMHICLYAA